MPANKTEVTIIPAIEERVYDKWAIDTIIIGTNRIDGTQHITVRFAECRELKDKSIEYSPTGKTLEVTESDIGALAKSHPKVAIAMMDLQAAIYDRAAERGVL